MLDLWEGRAVTNNSLPIATQVRLAFQKQNRVEALAGTIMGGYVPIAVYEMVHYELVSHSTNPLYLQPKAVLVFFGLVFSLITVFVLARDAFTSVPKALGFAVLVEGAMTMSDNQYLSLAGLAILIVINGLSTACNLALVKQSARPEKVVKVKPVVAAPPTVFAKRVK